MAEDNSRRIYILRLLSDAQGYVTCAQLKQNFGVSDKTIYNDIAKLNEELSGYGIRVISIPRHGMKLEGDRKDIQSFLNSQDNGNTMYSPSYRQIEIVRRLIVLDQIVNYEEMADEYLVSASSIRGDIEKIRKVLMKTDAKIVSNNTGTSVRGSERQIQNALKLYITNMVPKRGNTLMSIETEPVMKQIFDESILLFVYDITEGLSRNNHKPLSTSYLNSLFISLACMLARASHGKHVEKDKEFVFQNMKYMETYMIALSIADKINKEMALVLHENDIEYISELLFVHGIEPTLKKHKPDEVFVTSVDSAIKEMSSILQVDLTHDSKLKESLLSHVVPMIYRLKNGFIIKNPLLESIKRRYIVMFSLTWYVSSIFEQKFQISLNDDEVSFLTIHFQVGFDRKYKPKNILIVCPIGLSTSELVFNKVRQIIPEKDNVETASLEQIYHNDISDVSFIISLTPLQNIDKKVIYVSPLLTQNDISEISHYYLDLNEKINSLRDNKKTGISLLINYIDPDFNYFQYNCTDRDQVLDSMISRYEQQNLVTKDFRQSIFSREKMGVTSISTGVAMPHAAMGTVKKSRISIMTLLNPIDWEGNMVQMVVLLAVSEEDANQIKEVVSELCEIFESKEMIERVLRVKNNLEFAKLLEDWN